jgi:coenzyme A diphosphatase NUDT7
MSLSDRFKSKLSDPTQLLGRDKFVHAAVLVPCIEVDGHTHLLFQKRAAHIRQGGEICFPGGLRDEALDTSYRDTAVRETAEELGIDEDAIEVLGPLGTFVSPTGILIECFAGELHAKVADLDPPESETEFVFTLPMSKLATIPCEDYSLRAEFHSTTTDDEGNEVILLPSRELDLPERYLHRWSGNHYRVYVYRTEFGAIWGITGEILREFMRVCTESD